MSLEDLGNIGELVSALAVVATLVYLAAQIRQNTRVVRSSTDQAATDAHAGYLSLLASNPELTSLYRRGASREPLDEDETLRFGFLLHHVFAQVQASYFHHRHGVISSEQWQNVQRVTSLWLSAPGVWDWWQREKRILRDDFVEYVDSEILAERAE